MGVGAKAAKEGGYDLGAPTSLTKSKSKSKIQIKNPNPKSKSKI